MLANFKQALTNIYFRPYDFVSVYQCVVCVFFLSCSDLVYIRAMERVDS